MNNTNAENDPFKSLRVLIVEDNYLVARMIKGDVERFGCTTLGPVSSLEAASEIIEAEHIDGALLDINIIGGHSGPIAEMLEDRHIPFFFITGYASPAMLPEHLHQHTRLLKPIDVHTLRETMEREFLTGQHKR